MLAVTFAAADHLLVPGVGAAILAGPLVTILAAGVAATLATRRKRRTAVELARQRRAVSNVRLETLANA